MLILIAVMVTSALWMLNEQAMPGVGLVVLRCSLIACIIVYFCFSHWRLYETQDMSRFPVEAISFCSCLSVASTPNFPYIFLLTSLSPVVINMFPLPYAYFSMFPVSPLLSPPSLLHLTHANILTLPLLLPSFPFHALSFLPCTLSLHFF